MSMAVRLVAMVLALAMTDSRGPAGWTWEDPRGATGGPPRGTDGNWGMESTRFPSAWNVLDSVRHRDGRSQVVVFDQGFQSAHPELPGAWMHPICATVAQCSQGPAFVDAHGTHVAGTVGAAFDNPGDPPATTTFGVMLRLGLAAALGVGMVFWPYPSRCGPWLFAYLGAAGVLMSAGLWSAVWSWRHRAHKSHILSLLLVLWGGTLAAAEVLPKLGYAIPSEDHPAAWFCN